MLIEKNLGRERGIQGWRTVCLGLFRGTCWAAPCVVSAEEEEDEAVYPHPGATWFFPLAVEGAKTISIDINQQICSWIMCFVMNPLPMKWMLGCN